MKYVKEVGLIMAGASAGFVFGAVSIFAAGLKSKTIKQTLTKIIADNICNALLGPQRTESTPYRVSYRHYYENRNLRSTENIVFKSLSEAERVLSELTKIKNTYDVVTVADLYDLAGLENKYTDNQRGWTNLDSAMVVRTYHGYALKLPRALPLN